MSNVHPCVPALFVAFGVFGISFGAARSLQPAGPASVGRAPLASAPSLPAPPASDDTPLTDLQPTRTRESAPAAPTASAPSRSKPPKATGSRADPPAEDLGAFQRQVDLAAERRGDSDREERRPEPKSPRCMVCGAPADSWVESDGVSRGYCRAHYGPASPPAAAAPPAGPIAAVATPPTTPQTVPPGAVASAPTAETPPAPSQEPARSATGSAQCRGTTRDGDRCRRKTRDPSGLCYQHQRTR